MRRIPLIAGAALAVSVLASPALGDLRIKCVDFNGDWNVNVYIDADGSGMGGYSSPWDMAVGRIKWVVQQDGTEESAHFHAGDTVYAFCAEVAETVYLNHTYTFEDETGDGIGVMPVDDDPSFYDPGADGMDDSIVPWLVSLYDQFYYEAAGLSGHTFNTDKAVGFQLATWELVYEGQVLTDHESGISGTSDFDVTSGYFKVGTGTVSSSAVTYANDWLALLSPDYGSDLLGLWINGVQDQFLYPVPLPAPLLLAGVGLIGVFAGRKKLARMAISRS